MASPCAARSGASSVSTYACVIAIRGVEIAKLFHAIEQSAELSNASTVFSKVGGFRICHDRTHLGELLDHARLVGAA